MNGLGEYPGLGPVPDNHGAVDRQANGGPVRTPIIPPRPGIGGGPGGGDSCCEKLLRSMQSPNQSKPLGKMIEDQGQFLADAMPAGMAIKSFVFTPGAPVNVVPVSSGGAPTRVATGLINEGFNGILQTFMASVDPAGAMQDMMIQLKVSGEVQSKLTQNGMSMDDDGKDIPFYLEVQPGRTIELWITNNGSAAVYASGTLKGFMRPIK